MDVGELTEEIPSADEEEAAPVGDVWVPPALRDSARKAQEAARVFLGGGACVNVPLDAPRYYCDLLAWAFDRRRRAGWCVTQELGFTSSVPTYAKVNTAPGKWEGLVFRGMVLLARGDDRLVVSLRIVPEVGASLVVTSRSCRADLGKTFVRGIERLMNEKNIYRGRSIQLGSRVRFVDVPVKGWQDICIAPSVRDELHAHTVGFLQRAQVMERYGIPLRRGVLLAGRPGTGKTLACKVLMGTSSGITCVCAHSSGLVQPAYIEELYGMAQDLRPSIVFIEDIDLIGQGRLESCYSRGEALAQLLGALDGIEECHLVVTVATTNWLDMLDEALKDRPSRFDRIIRFEPPARQERRAYMDYLAQRIPIPEATMEWLAERTEGLTPAQIQEVVHSTVIESGLSSQDEADWSCVFSLEAVESALVKVKRKAGPLGFDTGAARHGDMVRCFEHRN